MVYKDFVEIDFVGNISRKNLSQLSFWDRMMTFFKAISHFSTLRISSKRKSLEKVPILTSPYLTSRDKIEYVYRDPQRRKKHLKSSIFEQNLRNISPRPLVENKVHYRGRCIRKAVVI